MKTKYDILKDYYFENSLFNNRIVISIISIFIFTIILVVNLYYLQIIHFNEYNMLSNENRIRLIPTIPNRGTIYDRNGIALALNKNVYNLEILSNSIDTVNIIKSLSKIIKINDKDVINFKKKFKKNSNLLSFPIKIGLTEIQKSIFAVNKYKFPNVIIKEYKKRYYPYKSILAHVIGYVSKISVDTLMNKNNIILNNSIKTYIGKLGVEKFYEKILYGKIGYEKVEVNNKGIITRKLNEYNYQNGNNITLTIDLNLQKYISKLINKNKAAVIVANPKDGSILALLSNPSYDPNLFVEGISIKNFNKLLNDCNLPLINRATQGVYPPASTIKPYISVSALTSGIIDKNFSLFDPGWWKLPGSDKLYHDWKHCGHGQVNIIKALEESSDTFFYQIAYSMGIDNISTWMNKFGYGKYTGIDILEENTGILPNRKWKIEHFHKSWYRGDTIPVGIGQGYLVVTPIQMLKSLITLINNGTTYTPHLLNSITKDNKKFFYKQYCEKNININNPEFWEIVKQGMYKVANSSHGTASKSFIGSKYKAAVKSGTAQVYNLKNLEKNINIKDKLKDHKLMIAFAPFDNPKIALVVVLEHSGDNNLIGNITRKILDYALLTLNKIN